MKFVKIFEKYEVNKEGCVRNTTTNKDLKVTNKNGKLMCWLTINGKSKHVNITDLLVELQDQFIEIEEAATEATTEIKKRGRKGKGYKVTMIDGTILEFSANKEAMQHFKETCPDITYREDYFWYFVRNRMSKPMKQLGIAKVENI